MQISCDERRSQTLPCARLCCPAVLPDISELLQSTCTIRIPYESVFVMALKLILMRHAKSSWDQLVGDHERALNNRGYSSARTMGVWLKRCGHLPQEALVSNARRTRDTFYELGITTKNVEFLSSLYHPSTHNLLSALRSATAPSVILISHNPGVTELAGLLAKHPPSHDRFYDFPTCATWVGAFDIDFWKDLHFKTGNTLEFAIPREIAP